MIGRASSVQLLAVLAAPTAALAAGPLPLDPGTPPALYTVDGNDGYAVGRGMLFAADKTLHVNGAALYTQSKAGLNATFQLLEVFNTTGNLLSGATQLVSVTALLVGPLGFHQANFPRVTLSAGSLYLLQVTYAEAAEENWFFDFDPAFFGNPPVDIGPVTLIDGTQAGHTENFVAPFLQLQISNLVLFTDPSAFQVALDDAGMVIQAFWDFSPHSLPPGSVVPVDDPLNIETHGSNPDDPWGDLWPPEVNAVGFSSNTNPQGPLTPQGENALLFLTPGFLPELKTNALMTGSSSSFDIVVSRAHAAIEANLLTVLGPGLLRAAVYNIEDELQDEVSIAVASGQNAFLGALMTEGGPIGRVDVWNQSGGFEGIESLAVYTPACPWNCSGDGDGTVGIVDLLALLAQWGQSGSSCDDGRGVDVLDFLELLANWGPCP